MPSFNLDRDLRRTHHGVRAAVEQQEPIRPQPPPALREHHALRLLPTPLACAKLPLLTRDQQGLLGAEQLAAAIREDLRWIGP